MSYKAEYTYCYTLQGKFADPYSVVDRHTIYLVDSLGYRKSIGIRETG